ncbi:hypothetical protein B0H19DRAFT_1065871 [Mycena capillaripes]|nr:hypothetical protein B0H19DRAFT_1065871 [Mycena capillaripes]
MLLAVKAADPDVSLKVFKTQYAIRHADRSGDPYHPILFLQWNTPHYDGVRKYRGLAYGSEDFRTIGAAGTRIDCARDGVAGTGVRIPIFAVSTLVRVVLKPPSRLPHFLVAKPRPVRASRQCYGLRGAAAYILFQEVEGSPPEKKIKNGCTDADSLENHTSYIKEMPRITLLVLAPIRRYDIHRCPVAGYSNPQ